MSGSVSSKSNNKSSEWDACGEREVRDEVEVHGHREVHGGQGERQTEVVIYRILPSTAGCRLS